ncbi:MAG: phage tail protein [Clostridiales bacterium]|nr:phage tail protein [Clostridiales bacterium]
MIPCLYSATETAFTTNGIGKLADCISCVVTEKRNGSYELAMEYPLDGIHAEDIAEGAIICAKPADNRSSQAFRIYKITAQMDGILEIAARHISYQLNYITVSPLTLSSGTADQPALTFEALKENASTECPFSFVTDVASESAFSISEPTSFRNALGGIDGSMLDTFGSEFEWDMYTVNLWESRGADNGVRIIYGKNLVDFTMEKSIEDTITGVHPFWANAETDGIVELSEKVVTLAESDLPFDKIVTLDCSDLFDDEPSEDDLLAYAQAYLATTSYIEPDIDITIDFAQLWQTPGYEDIAEAERVSLCDTVHVYVSRLGIEVSAKVTETEYDVLLERNKSITLSNSTSSSRNKSLVLTLSQELDETIKSGVAKVTAIANGKTTTYYAADAPEETAYTINDIWYDTDDGYAMYYWTGEEWTKAPYGTNAIGEGVITTELLAAECVTAGKISVDKLSAINANLGDITGGSINIGSGTFSVDSSGNVTCSSIKITGGSITIGSNFSVTNTGIITAAAGTVGPLTISNSTDTSAASGHTYKTSLYVQQYGTSVTVWDATTDDSTVSTTVDAEFGIKATGSSLTALNQYLIWKKSGDAWSNAIIPYSVTGWGKVKCSGIDIYPTRAIYADGDGDLTYCDSELRCIYTGTYYAYLNLCKIVNDIDPASTNTYDFGGSSYRYRRIYVNTVYRSSEESLSDRKLKQNVKPLTEDYEQLIMGLTAVEYDYINGDSHRKHMGFIAQDVRDTALATVGDLSLFSASVIGDDDAAYSADLPDEQLRWYRSYEELIAPLVAMVQHQQRRIERLETSLAAITKEESSC